MMILEYFSYILIVFKCYVFKYGQRIPINFFIFASFVKKIYVGLLLRDQKSAFEIMKF